MVGPDNQTEEGSDDSQKSYDCDGAGNYTFERDNVTNLQILPKCLERREFIVLLVIFTINLHGIVILATFLTF